MAYEYFFWFLKMTGENIKKCQLRKHSLEHHVDHIICFLEFSLLPNLYKKKILGTSSWSSG